MISKTEGDPRDGKGSQCEARQSMLSCNFIHSHPHLTNTPIHKHAHEINREMIRMANIKHEIIRYSTVVP